MSGRQTFSIRGIGDPPPTTIGPLTAHWGSRTYVMAAINLTPDSFSGDGLYDAADTGGEIGEAILARVEAHARAAPSQDCFLRRSLRWRIHSSDPDSSRAPRPCQP